MGRSKKRVCFINWKNIVCRIQLISSLLMGSEALTRSERTPKLELKAATTTF